MRLAVETESQSQLICVREPGQVRGRILTLTKIVVQEERSARVEARFDEGPGGDSIAVFSFKFRKLE